MWSVSFSLLGGQYVIGDVYGIELTNTWTDFSCYTSSGCDGTVDNIKLKSHLLTIINEEQINEITLSIVNANFTTNSTYYDKVETSTTSAAFVAWELVLLLSGTYVFNLLYLMGVAPIFISFFVILYLAILSRAILGYIRGI